MCMAWKKGNRLPIVQVGEAAGRTAEIFSEVKAAFGIAYVPRCFQAFAAYPDFLEVQWRTMKPLLGTREFFELAARLRAEAYTYVHNYFKVSALGDGLTAANALSVTDLLCYVDAATLLLLAVQLQAFDGAVGEASSSPHTADRISFSALPEFVDVENAPAPIKRVADEMRLAFELPFSGDEQRALARWPELFFSYWHALKPAVQSVFHEQAVFRIRESAWSCAPEIPLSIEMEYARLQEAGVSADDIATVTRLTELLVRGAAVGLLNETFAKIGLEGGNHEVSSAQADQERVA
jgi:hypothetical protein